MIGNRILGLAAAALATVTLSGCQQQGATPAKTEAATAQTAAATGPASYTATASLEGGFWSGAEKAGPLHFAGVDIGNARSFGAWAGGDKSGGAPVALRFLDERQGYSPETDGPPDDNLYVLVAPTTYAVSDTHVSFTGTSPATGPVTFEAAVDQAELARSQQLDMGDLVVATGTLSVGGQTFRDIRMTWSNPRPN